MSTKTYKGYIGHSAGGNQQLEPEPFVAVLIGLEDDQLISLEEYDVSRLNQAIKVETNQKKLSVLRGLLKDLIKLLPVIPHNHGFNRTRGNFPAGYAGLAP